ncbi:MAG: metal-dependent hydrolase [Methylophaga sp.]|nr:metal-dependent hydrolase [Methylophaga sp.]
MASIFTHAFVAYGATTIFDDHPYWRRCLFFSVVLSLLPDADVVGFLIGVPYESPWGHRGATHSIVFSIMMAALVTGVFFRAYFQFKAKLLAVFIILSLSAISHGVLDAFTNGGLGIAFFWPFDNTRYFFNYRPVEVSPIGISGLPRFH